MKRWNGWGDTSEDYPLKPDAIAFLEARIGKGQPLPDAELDELLKAVPPSRLRPHPLLKTDAVERLTHSVGQSFPDWITMRFGRYSQVVDGVAYPTSSEDVRALLDYAKETNTHLIPFGGGTSVVGHLTPLLAEAPVLSVDMSRMNKLLELNEYSQLATFGAGILGPDLEAKLRAKGYTLGHFPQSFEYSTLGGWIATRSSGQQSLYYGRIENLFVGGEMETPLGRLEMPAIPASAAGPDVRQMVLGSEGRMGIITQAAVRITPVPETETFEGIFFPNFAAGLNAAREIVQDGLPVSMMRLSNPIETETSLMLSGHWAIGLLETYLAMRGAAEDKAMLILGLTGRKSLTRNLYKNIQEIIKSYQGVMAGSTFGNAWKKNRFHGAYLRNTLWDLGYGVDTLETAVTWDQTQDTMQDIEKAVRQSLENQVHVFTHLSHFYSIGSSVYTTYVFPLGPTAEETHQRWLRTKKAASQAILAHGGTISHQHGVGLDHAPYLAAEKGPLGLQAIDALLKSFDPQEIMNPKKLLE